MHPIWFLMWAWEKAWSDDGLLPLFEKNQGALSVAALGVALWAFIVETRRANREAQAAKDSEATRREEAEAAERRRRQEAEEAEAARRAYEDAARIREAVAARDADIVRRYDHMRTFTQTVKDLIAQVEGMIASDQAYLAAHAGLIFMPSWETRQRANVVSHVLTAIIPSAPMRARLVADVREIALDMAALAERSSSDRDPSIRYLAEQNEKLKAALMKMDERTSELRSELSLEGDLGFGADVLGSENI